jgi:hypothetical protein
MGFNFISDQPDNKMVDNTTTLSVNTKLVGEHAMATFTETDNTTQSGNDETMDLTQATFAEGEEEQLAIQFIEETGLYTKFLLYCGIQEQLKNLKLSVATPNE